MGPEYSKSYYLAMIILFPTLISGTQQIAKTTIIAKKLIKYQAKCMMVTGVMGLLVSYFLSMRIGAAGVCIGTALTSLCNIAYMNIIYKKKAGIDVFIFYKKCYLKLIPCYAIAIISGMVVVKLVTVNGWIGFLIKALLICIIYALTILFIYANKEEKRVLIKYAKKIIGVK